MSLQEGFPFRSPGIDLIKTNKGGILKFIGKTVALYVTQTDAIFLSLCDGTRSMSKIAILLSELYKVDSRTILNDITRLAEKLHELHVLVMLPMALEKRLSTMEDWHEFVFIPADESCPVVPARISSIGFALTNYCPYNCEYCYGAFGSENEAFYLPTAKVISIIEDARKLGKVEYVSLGGGDPIAHSGLSEIVSYLESCRITYELSTKGLLLSKKKVDELVVAGIRNIQISIDAWHPEVWSEIVGLPKHAFNSAIESFIYCKSANVSTRARITLSRRNLEELPYLLENLPFLGVSEIRIVTLMPSGRARINEIPNRDQIESALEVVEAFRSKYGNKPEIVFGVHRYTSSLSCGGAKLAMQIGADGEVLLCDVVEGLDRARFSYGNVFRNSIEEIWFSEQADAFRTNREISECLDCVKFAQCNGGCRALAFSYYNSYDSPDPRCSRISGKEGDILEWPVKRQPGGGGEIWRMKRR